MSENGNDLLIIITIILMIVAFMVGSNYGEERSRAEEEIKFCDAYEHKEFVPLYKEILEDGTLSTETYILNDKEFEVVK